MFDEFYKNVPGDVSLTTNYFKVNYIKGVIGREKRRAANHGPSQNCTINMMLFYDWQGLMMLLKGGTIDSSY